MLCINGLFHCLFCFTQTKWMTVMEWLSCLWQNLMYMSLWYLYVYVTPFPNGYLLFRPFVQFSSVWIIFGLVKSVFHIRRKTKWSVTLERQNHIRKEAQTVISMIQESLIILIYLLCYLKNICYPKLSTRGWVPTPIS